MVGNCERGRGGGGGEGGWKRYNHVRAKYFLYEPVLKMAESIVYNIHLTSSLFTGQTPAGSYASYKLLVLFCFMH